MSFSDVLDSGFFDCRVVDNEDNFIQFHVVVNANCESNENCSSAHSFSSINPTIDVSTTTSSIPTELLRQDILQHIKFKESGDGLMADQPYKGVCCNKSVVVGAFLCFSFSLFYRTFWC